MNKSKPLIAAGVAVITVVLLVSTFAQDHKHESSYLPVDIKESFQSIMARM